MHSVEPFSFGKNWGRFTRKHFDESRVGASKSHMLDVLGLDSLEGLSFLDIGSGLHSLAALRAGATSIHSFAYDTHSAAGGIAARSCEKTVLDASQCDFEGVNAAIVASTRHAQSIENDVRQAAGRAIDVILPSTASEPRSNR